MLHLRRSSSLFLAVLTLLPFFAVAQAGAQTNVSREKIIVDTDIGDDIDDAFAVDLVLASHEFQVLGIGSAWGDTALRSRMLDRMLCETGRDGVPVLTGVPTKTDTVFTQAPWAKAGVEHTHGDAVAALLEQIRQHPGEITLLAVGPLTNIGTAIDRDAETFRKLKRVVMMGGSIYRGYGAANAPPQPEYNIARDPAAAQKLFRSGVPIFMLPLDATQVKFDAAKRGELAAVSTPMTDTLLVLTAEWSHSTKQSDPTLFDAIAAAYALDASSCPMKPLHIEVDDKGMTKPTDGTPNAQACLEPHEDAFYGILMPRLLHQNFAGDRVCIAKAR
jgi:inosine-uridine nucleoside N-ribohydrolase